MFDLVVDRSRLLFTRGVVVHLLINGMIGVAGVILDVDGITGWVLLILVSSYVHDVWCVESVTKVFDFKN